MIYLINQPLTELEMSETNLRSVRDEIQMAQRTEELVSALDAETAKTAGEYLVLDLPEFDTVFFQGATPDDTPITLSDNLELGDTVISIDCSHALPIVHRYDSMSNGT